MPNLKINFYDFRKEGNDFDSLEFLKTVREINNNVISIPIDEKLFDSLKDVFIAEISIFKKGKEIEKSTFVFNLYFGETIINLSLKRKSRPTSYEFLFLEQPKDFLFESNDYKFESDSFGTMRRRIVIINTSCFSLTVNGKDIGLSYYLPNIKDYEYKKPYSFQFSFYNIEKEIISSKPIQIKDINKKLINYEESKDSLTEFYNEFNLLINKYNIDNPDEVKFIEEASNLRKKYSKIDEIQIRRFNRKKKELDSIFNKAEMLDILYYNELFKIFIKFQKNKSSYFIKLHNLSLEFKNKIEKDNNLRLYHKCFLIFQYFLRLKKEKSLEDFINLNFSYYHINEFENNSVFMLLIDFYNKFADGLNEKSLLFNPILQLNSGLGNYKTDYIYTFNMFNEEMIRAHLKEISPEVFITFYKDSKLYASTNKNTGMICFNLKLCLENSTITNLKGSLDKSEIIKGKELAIRFFTFILHELIGHKKFSFQNYDNNRISTKKVCINDKIYNLENVNYKIKNENENIIKILSSKKKKGDSGHFIQWFLGQNSKGEFIFKIMRKLNDIYKLYDHPEYFTDNLEKLQNYIKYKYNIKQNNSIIYFDESISIDEEINELKKYEKDHNVIINIKKDVKGKIFEFSKNINNSKINEKNIITTDFEEKESESKMESDEEDNEGSDDNNSNKYNKYTLFDGEEDELLEYKNDKKIKYIIENYSYEELERILDNNGGEGISKEDMFYFNLVAELISEDY